MRKPEVWARANRRRPSAPRRRLLVLAALLFGLVALFHQNPCYTVPTTFGGKYSLNEADILGAGAYGSVYECRDNTGQSYAVKVIPMWRMQLDNDKEAKKAELDAEIDVHKHIGHHENVVQLVESIEIEGDVQGWPRWKMVVLELAKGGELSDLIEKHGRLEVEKAKHITKQILEAVKHLHERRVIHRDLKTDNVLICTDSTHDANRPAVKLIDFGAGHWAKDGAPMLATKCIGTIDTMAPEVILARGDDFDASDPSQVDAVHEIEFRTRPFGVRKYAPGPGGKGARVVEVIAQERYKGDPLGQAFKKGVRNGWVVKSVGGIDVTQMAYEDILDLMGDRLLDNSSRGAFDGSFKVTGDNKGKGKILPQVEMVPLPATLEYAEVKKKPYNEKVDVWSLGCMIYQMVGGRNPFAATEEAVMAGTFEPLEGVPPELNDLLSRMLVVDPEQRLDLNAVAMHPWVTGQPMPAGYAPPPPAPAPAAAAPAPVAQPQAVAAPAANPYASPAAPAPAANPYASPAAPAPAANPYAAPAPAASNPYASPAAAPAANPYANPAAPAPAAPAANPYVSAPAAAPAPAANPYANPAAPATPAANPYVSAPAPAAAAPAAPAGGNPYARPAAPPAPAAPAGGNPYARPAAPAAPAAPAGGNPYATPSGGAAPAPPASSNPYVNR